MLAVPEFKQSQDHPRVAGPTRSHRTGPRWLQPVYLLTASASCLGRLKVNLQWPAVKVLAIQTGNGGTGFMTFHFDKAKTLALAGKNICHELE